MIRTYLIFIIVSTSLFGQYASDTTKSLAFKRNRFDVPLLAFRPIDVTYQVYSLFVLIQKANAGEPQAQYEAGMRYFLGQGFEADTNKSVYWLEKAAAQNYTDALYNLAIFYNNGWGVNWNPFKAFSLFLKAAEKGMPQAQYAVGLMYTENLLMPRSLKEAYIWIDKAANQKFEPAVETLKELKRRNISSDYVDVKEEENNKQWSLQYIDFTADNNFTITDSILIDDLLRVNDSLFFQLKTLDKISNIPDSIKRNLEIFADSGSPEALTILGRMYEKSELLLLAFSYYLRAVRSESYRAGHYANQMLKNEKFASSIMAEALKGNNIAGYVWALLNSLSFDSKFFSEDAKKLLKKSADDGFIPSINEYACLNYTGQLFAVNRNEAIKYWKLGEKLGSNESQARLMFDKILSTPDIVTSDDIDNLYYLTEQGSVLAEVILGYCYENGLGTVANKYKAVYFYRRSAFRGSRIGFSSLIRMYDSVRPNSENFKMN